MIKGCKKNVVYVRNMESDLFREAYFILSDDFEEKERSEPDMIAEANRIISETPVASYFGMSPGMGKKKRSDRLDGVAKGFWFMSGAFFASLIALVIGIL
jgi:hypothetical protein